MISPVLVELRDNTGQMIAWKLANQIYTDSTQADHCPGYMKFGAPSQGRSQQRLNIGLGEQYPRLSPGQYSMTVTFCISDSSERLVSNTIFLTIE